MRSFPVLRLSPLLHGLPALRRGAPHFLRGNRQERQFLDLFLRWHLAGFAPQRNRDPGLQEAAFRLARHPTSAAVFQNS